LSGVAPRAQIGNYRVFNVPTPAGHVGNTPEIVAAFEAAVRDGMDVINFSGGGPQVDPASDAIIEAVRNVAAAGVVGDLTVTAMTGLGSWARRNARTRSRFSFQFPRHGPALTVTAPGAQT
jgi:subtilisin family serine protease